MWKYHQHITIAVHKNWSSSFPEGSRTIPFTAFQGFFRIGSVYQLLEKQGCFTLWYASVIYGGAKYDWKEHSACGITENSRTMWYTHFLISKSFYYDWQEPKICKHCVIYCTHETGLQSTSQSASTVVQLNIRNLQVGFLRRVIVFGSIQ